MNKEYLTQLKQENLTLTQDIETSTEILKQLKINKELKDKLKVIQKDINDFQKKSLVIKTPVEKDIKTPVENDDLDDDLDEFGLPYVSDNEEEIKFISKRKTDKKKKTKKGKITVEL